MAAPFTDDSLATLQEYSRGLIGGLLFGLPLLYTMEVWWTGFLAGPLRLGSALQQGEVSVLPVEVLNRGGEPAAEVRVRITSSAGEDILLVFDYVPQHSRREGRVTMEDARLFGVEARIESYSLP